MKEVPRELQPRPGLDLAYESLTPPGSCHVVLFDPEAPIHVSTLTDLVAVTFLRWNMYRVSHRLFIEVPSDIDPDSFHGALKTVLLPHLWKPWEEQRGTLVALVAAGSADPSTLERWLLQDTNAEESLVVLAGKAGGRAQAPQHLPTKLRWIEFWRAEDWMASSFNGAMFWSYQDRQWLPASKSPHD